jgi:hypothetical protein
MKLQLASDLHLEYLPKGFIGVAPAPGADALILAGDIHIGTSAIDVFKDWPVPVLYVPGNHEFFNHDFERLRDDFQRAARGTSVTVLDDMTIELGGVRFLGATMWTDYRAIRSLPAPAAMELSNLKMPDSGYITRVSGNPFWAADALAEHKRSRRWLQDELSKPFSGPTVVITHHGCTAGSVSPKHANSLLNASFVSDLTSLMTPDVKLWAHGHVHHSFDYPVKTSSHSHTRVRTNPRGVAMNPGTATSARDVIWENADFDPLLLVSLSA